MTHETSSRVGFTCAYTPLPLIDAAGLVPVRLRPDGDAPEEAATLLHDNLCPHVKRVLDRRLDDQLGELSGVVIMGSCDAMRRLGDAWRVAAPEDRLTVVDLPVTADLRSVAYLAGQIQGLAETLSEWSGRAVTPDGLAGAAERRDELARALATLDGTVPGGSARLQELRNLTVTARPEVALEAVTAAAALPRESSAGVPIFLHGNVLPAPDALEMIESCGARIVADDLCTGAHQLTAPAMVGEGNVWSQLARGLLERPRCARTLTARPVGIAEEVTRAAAEAGAAGVVAHVAKFCDPYLARLPALRESLRQAGLPLLVLEGDCTMRSLGQHRTRIEAFVEMLG